MLKEEATGELGCGFGWAGPAGEMKRLEIGPGPDLRLWKMLMSDLGLEFEFESFSNSNFTQIKSK
jgi:hypothetical protein